MATESEEEKLYKIYRSVYNKTAIRRLIQPEPRWKNLRPWKKKLWQQVRSRAS